MLANVCVVSLSAALSGECGTESNVYPHCCHGHVAKAIIHNILRKAHSSSGAQLKSQHTGCQRRVRVLGGKVRGEVRFLEMDKEGSDEEASGDSAVQDSIAGDTDGCRGPHSH